MMKINIFSGMLLVLLLVLIPCVTVYSAEDFEVITVSTSPVGFNAAKIRPSYDIFMTQAKCTLEGGDIRFIEHSGGDPSVGHLLEAGTPLTVREYTALENFRAQRAAGSDGILRCSYE